MNKIAVLLTAVLVSVFALIRLTDFGPSGDSTWWAQRAKVRDWMFRYGCFKEVLVETIEDLEGGRTDLRTAQRRVEAASRQWYPEYLAFLNEPGATDEERVARNLVGHVASRMLFEAPRVRELENEYRQMFRAKAGVAGRV